MAWHGKNIAYNSIEQNSRVGMIISRGLVKGKTTMYISIRSKDIDSEYLEQLLVHKLHFYYSYILWNCYSFS